MILSNPVYHFYTRQEFNRVLSFIKTPNVVDTIEQAEIVIFLIYDIINISNIEINNILSQNKKIIIDSSYELIWIGILNKLAELDNLHNIEYYGNSHSDDYASELIDQCRQKGLVIHQSQFFADYQNYYRPIETNKNVDIEKKKYVLHTGKTRPERTLMIAMLACNDLLRHGYVSYFGNNFNEYYKDGKIEDVFNLPELINNTEMQFKIKQGLDSLKLPLTIDVPTLSYRTAHSKEFNADYYLASEFAVVCETDYDHNFFITEKTIKCILLDKKFLVYSSLNYVSKLKEYYLTKFSKDISHLTDWCDLAYDSEPDKGKRAELIVEEIKKAVLK